MFAYYSTVPRCAACGGGDQRACVRAETKRNSHTTESLASAVFAAPRRRQSSTISTHYSDVIEVATSTLCMCGLWKQAYTVEARQGLSFLSSHSSQLSDPLALAAQCGSTVFSSGRGYLALAV